MKSGQSKRQEGQRRWGRAEEYFLRNQKRIGRVVVVNPVISESYLQIEQDGQIFMFKRRSGRNFEMKTWECWAKKNGRDLECKASLVTSKKWPHVVWLCQAHSCDR